MGDGDLCHGQPGDSPARSRPFETMLVKLEELDSYTHTILFQFPKAERHILSADIRCCLNHILRLTITAWRRYHKKTTLSELDIEIDVLRHLIRKSLRLKYITPKRYQIWAGHVDEMGRMLGGWMRHENK